MRASFVLIILMALTGLFLWVTLSGALFAFGSLFWLMFIIISMGYADVAILFFLGAREVRSGDEEVFYQAVSQEAYKLAVSMPKLYIYNGSLNRGFIFSNRGKLSLVLNKTLLGNLKPHELSAICFGLLLQVKKGMSSSRTRVFFIIGMLSWISHYFVRIVFSVIPSKEAKEASDWTINFLLSPWIMGIFRLTLGSSYFKKLKSYLEEYPYEKEELFKVGLKLRSNHDLYSLPTKKLMELASVMKTQSFQNIIALEHLPHEWDLMIPHEELLNAAKA